jgi:acetylornithine/N-succinyldiaminopimelate aminotransferase
MSEPGFLDRVSFIGNILRQGLEEVCAPYPKIIAEIRGVGLMLGLKCVTPNTELIEKLRNNGLLTVGAGDNVVRLLPPLTISESEVNHALTILSDTLAEVAA